MSRIEENKILNEMLMEEAERNPTRPYNEMVAFHLGAIALTLIDISKSLAILADKVESDGWKIMLTKITGLEYMKMSKHDIYEEYCKLYEEYEENIEGEIKRLKTELNNAKIDAAITDAMINCTCLA